MFQSYDPSFDVFPCSMLGGIPNDSRRLSGDSPANNITPVPTPLNSSCSMLGCTLGENSGPLVAEGISSIVENSDKVNAVVNAVKNLNLVDQLKTKLNIRLSEKKRQEEVLHH